MLFQADVLCPQCKKRHVLKVEHPTIPDTRLIFRYRCPITTELVKESLDDYKEVSAFPENVIPGWRI